MEQMLIQLMPLFLIFAIFYFLLIRPQQRRAKEHKEMVAAVQRGDKIVSSGGIRGKVMKVIGDTDVEVEISSGVNVVIIKSTIAEVERDSSAK
ncbi:MAG: preprotein translocase subunit YajC [Rickettsiales bacterium]|jgi:preprotein translocase subunit YajC|nr:preprotein translocase subunit YajC [Rickettsiales bacterium]|tara:strand:+ start:6672 stop:6950 length:279 start_codon:yes stop_codon:yes gene_type:complete